MGFGDDTWDPIINYQFDRIKNSKMVRILIKGNFWVLSFFEFSEFNSKKKLKILNLDNWIDDVIGIIPIPTSIHLKSNQKKSLGLIRIAGLYKKHKSRREK